MQRTNERGHRTARARAIPAFFAGLALVFGCGAGPEGGGFEEGVENTASVDEAMNGTATFPNATCNRVGGDGTINAAGGVDYRPLIRRAVTRATNQLGSSGMLPCMNQHFVAANNGTSPETILQNMREAMSTAFTCEQFPLDSENGANAPILAPGQPEQVNINSRTLPRHTEQTLASTILHEVAHNKGYNHAPDHEGSEYPFTVTEQLAACSLRMSGQVSAGPFPPPTPYPNGPRVDEITRATFLAQIGGPGTGSARAGKTCFSGGFARGLVGRHGARIDAVGLSCTDKAGHGTETVAASGGTGGTAFTSDCGRGKVMIGLIGHADHLVNRLVPICGDAALVRAGTPSSLQGGIVAGTAVGNPFVRVCPWGKAVKSMQVRAGSVVDQIRLECETMAEGFIQTQSALTAIGTATRGVLYRERCPTGSVMTAINGQADGSFIMRLGGMCQQVRDDGESVSPITLNLPPICDSFGCRGRGDGRIPLQSQGAFFGAEWPTSEEGCSPGSALVGMILQSGVDGNFVAPLRRVRGICARITDWSTPDRVITFQHLPDHGGGGVRPAAQTLTCPRRQFLTGWEIRADGNGVHQLQGVCTLSHHSGSGQNCYGRCDTNCTANIGFPPDAAGINQCINDCRRRCDTL
jgi:hypothetical protein